MSSATSKLLLASGSPRRKAILQEAGFAFEVKSMDVDESYPADLALDETAEYLAVKKNKFYRAKFPNYTILSADTVVIGDKFLGKPENDSEAKSMLSALSGKSHDVITGICISNADKLMSASSETRVTFRRLSDREIDHYIATSKPYDKAGAYGIQEWIGMIGIERIEGSYFNVVGLPIHLVYSMLTEEFAISPLPLR